MKNPYRYRGYRYDTETGLYYLNSRYYNPEWGRFINADALGGQVGSLLSHNIFAYCQNNVVNMADPSGFVMICMTDGCSGRSNVITNKSTNKSNKKLSLAINVVKNSSCAAADTKIAKEVSDIIPQYLKLGVNRAVRRGTAYPTATLEAKGVALSARNVAKAV